MCRDPNQLGWYDFGNDLVLPTPFFTCSHIYQQCLESNHQNCSPLSTTEINSLTPSIVFSTTLNITINNSSPIDITLPHHYHHHNHSLYYHHQHALKHPQVDCLLLDVSNHNVIHHIM